MKLALCVTTYNRLGYLQALLSSFAKTRDFRHDWRVYVVDDGSTDGTVEFLRSQAVHLIQQRRLGVHEAKNRLFEAALADGCEFGWQVDDDVVFRVLGWDQLYLDAAESTGFEHLVLYDAAWAHEHRRDSTTQLQTTQHLQSAVPVPQACQGACWTFSRAVVERIGWFDAAAFGPCGYGHTDYTLRACRAGCNEVTVDAGPWDALHSELFLNLQRERYKPAIPAAKRLSAAFGHTPLHQKIALLNDSSRVYAPRQKPRYDMEGNALG